MSITLVGTSSAANNGSGASSYNVTPPTMREKDLLIVIYGWGGGADDAVGLPSGNNSGAYLAATGDLYSNDARDANGRVAYQIQGATPDTAVSVPSSANTGIGSSCCCVALRGVMVSNVFDAGPSTATGGNTGAVNPPLISPNVFGSFIVVGGIATDDATPTAVSGWTGYSNFTTRSAAGSTYGVHTALAIKTWSSGAENPPAWSGGPTAASDAWIGVTMSICPNPYDFPRTIMLIQD